MGVGVAKERFAGGGGRVAGLVGGMGVEDSDEGWSSAELRMFGGGGYGGRDCGSFSTGVTQGGKRRSEWHRIGRRRSMDLEHAEEGAGAGVLRVCRSSVSLLKDKERRRRVGRREDRSVETEVDRRDCAGTWRRRWMAGGSGGVEEEWRGAGGVGDGQARCNSDPALFRCGKSFQSSNSSVALSVSTVTQTSHCSH